jgi:hypothetical protein
MNKQITDSFINLLTATTMANPKASQLEIAVAVGGALFEESVKQSQLNDRTKTVLDMFMSLYRAKGWEGDAAYTMANTLLEELK